MNMPYRFTRTLPNQVCRICGQHFDSRWSHGGMGALCQTCAPLRDNYDLVAMGLIRNIQRVKSKSMDYSYIFEALIDGQWRGCGLPCGDWSMMMNEPHDTVPVGWWELDELYRRHGNETEVNP